jgi:hypothetical protein
MLFVQIDSTPFLPTLFEFRKNRFQILADIFAACHSIWKGDAPNSPSLRLGRDNKGVAFIASFAYIDWLHR